MKSNWKVSLVALAAGALALVLILGATIGTAAASDIVFMGNGKGTAGVGNNVKIIDIDSMSVVNTIANGTNLANNHGVLLDGTTLWNANATIANYKDRAVAIDLSDMSQTVYEVSANGGQNFAGGFCGIEKAPDGSIWATAMDGGTDRGGVYNVQTGAYVDTSSGTDGGATCGINWNTAGNVAYSSLMGQKKVTRLGWPGGAYDIGTTVSQAGLLHISDLAKSSGYMYVAGGNVSNQGKLYVIRASDMMEVNVINTSNPGDPHGPTVTADENTLYLHSRTPGVCVQL